MSRWLDVRAWQSIGVSERVGGNVMTPQLTDPIFEIALLPQ